MAAGDEDTGPVRLDRARVVAGAVALADQVGVEPVTMRRLADTLGTKPMTLYSHVANKDDLLDGMVDHVFAAIDPPPDLPWRAAVRHRCVSAREVLRVHPWAVPLLESRRSPGPATLEHHEAVLACLFGGGLATHVVATAYAVLDAYVYGFAVQEASLPGGGAGDDLTEVGSDIAGAMDPAAFPSLTRFMVEHAMQPGYDFGAEFEVGLDLVLDGLELLAGG
jgi:AcrR family transcriptional regulator